MLNRTYFLLTLLLCACQTTPDRKEPVDTLDAKKKDPKAAAEAAADEDTVTIRPDELEPVRRFVLETRRVIAAEFVRINTTAQFFEQQLGYTRDLRYVDREMKRLKDGTRVVILKNSIRDQKTNLDPNLLPRVYFGASGLEIRAYREIRIYLRNSKNKDRPIYLDVLAKNSVGDVMMWVTGRLQHNKPSLHLRSELIYSEEKQEYLHRTSIG